MKDNVKYLECSCGSNDHVIKFELQDGDNYDVGSVSLSVQMSQYHAWYSRIWNAIKYIFGYESRFGHWDCTLLEYHTLKEFQVWINDAVVECEKDPRAKHML